MTVREAASSDRWHQELEGQNRRPAAALENISEGIAVTRDGKILEVNPALCRMTGFPAREAPCLDLDGSKDINDSSGHAAGDAILTGVALLLRETLREAHSIGRLGGDEFAGAVARCQRVSRPQPSLRSSSQRSERSAQRPEAHFMPASHRRSVRCCRRRSREQSGSTASVGPLRQPTGAASNAAAVRRHAWLGGVVAARVVRRGVRRASAAWRGA